MLELSFGTKRGCAIALVLSASMAALSSFAAPVKPPPRTVGSGSLVIEPGETRSARARYSRERTNVVRNKPNFTGKASTAIPVNPDGSPSPDGSPASPAAPAMSSPTMRR